jgi:hypothetical protein
VILNDSYVKKKSYKSFDRRFHRKCPGLCVPVSSTIFKTGEKLLSTRSFLGKTYTRQNTVLTEAV